MTSPRRSVFKRSGRGRIAQCRRGAREHHRVCALGETGQSSEQEEIRGAHPEREIDDQEIDGRSLVLARRSHGGQFVLQPSAREVEHAQSERGAGLRMASQIAQRAPGGLERAEARVLEHRAHVVRDGSIELATALARPASGAARGGVGDRPHQPRDDGVGRARGSGGWSSAALSQELLEQLLARGRLVSLARQADWGIGSRSDPRLLEQTRESWVVEWPLACLEQRRGARNSSGNRLRAKVLERREAQAEGAGPLELEAELGRELGEERIEVVAIDLHERAAVGGAAPLRREIPDDADHEGRRVRHGACGPRSLPANPLVRHRLPGRSRRAIMPGRRSRGKGCACGDEGRPSSGPRSGRFGPRSVPRSSWSSWTGRPPSAAPFAARGSGRSTRSFPAWGFLPTGPSPGLEGSPSPDMSSITPSW